MKKQFILTFLALFCLTQKVYAQFLPDSNSCFSNQFGLELTSGNKKITACDPVTLETKSNGSPFIVWSTGNFGGQTMVYNSGVYYAYALDSAGCFDTTASISVEIQDNKVYAYSNTFYTTFCAGSSLTLTASSQYPGKWNTGSTQSEITINSGGKYYFVSTSDSGCKDTSNILDITEIKVDKPKITVTGKTTICKQDTTWLEASSANKISWYPYGYDGKVRATVSGPHYAIAMEQTLGCVAYSDTVMITVFEPFAESLCMVTNDSNTGKNMLMWKKTPGKRTEKYEIYREANNGGYEKIGTVNYSSTPKFIDSNSNPRQRAYSYYLKAIDSCGNAAEESIYYIHTTSHLTASLGVSGENNLNWSPYLGAYPLNGYAIYRSNGSGAFQEIDRVASTKNSYSDLNPPQGSNRYYIAIIAEVDCGSGKGSIRFRSNQVQFGTASVADIQTAQISVYPNPASASTQVTTSAGGDFQVRDISGRIQLKGKMKPGTQALDVSALADGTYFIFLNQTVKKIQVTR
ncbi:MAG: T9SS type A sorting domain-containing protein [Bacteroidetes bacterium]|nr:T9SS type A sorting domain-containing protein [Bacteroidota bacterium]